MLECKFSYVVFVKLLRKGTTTTTNNQQKKVGISKKNS